MKDDELPRTVWFDSADVFLRRTCRRSGDRGGGGGGADADTEADAECEAETEANDELDLRGDVVSANDDLEAEIDLVGDLEGTLSTAGLGGDCSMDCNSECRVGSGEERGVRPLILATRFETVELRSLSRDGCVRGWRTERLESSEYRCRGEVDSPIPIDVDGRIIS